MGDVAPEKIALITGLEFEAALARRVLKECESETLVYVSGLGAPFAQRVIEEAKQAGAKGIVSYGVCGGLDPALKAGSIALPKSILGSKETVVDLQWHNWMYDLLISDFDITTDKLLTVESAVETVEEKTALFEKTGASVVDMESSILANQAAKHGLAFIAVRVVHDPASQTVPKAMRDVINSDGKINAWKMLKGLFTNWPGAKVLKQMSDNDMQARANLKSLTRLVLLGSQG